MIPLVAKVRGDVSPKKFLAFTATESKYLGDLGLPNRYSAKRDSTLCDFRTYHVVFI